MISPAALVDLPRRFERKMSHAYAQRRLARQMADAVADASPADRCGRGPKIGFATFGSGCWHLGLELLLAHALRQRGAQPEMLVCDLPDLPICNERTAHSTSRNRCDGCLDDKRALLTAGEMPWRPVSAFATDALRQATAVVAALGDDELSAHVERGLPLGQWLHVSACHFLRREGDPSSAEMIETRRRLLATSIVMAGAVERWLESVRPDVVIAQSGAHLPWRIAVEMARAKGVRVVCRELGKGGFDHHLYSVDADCMAPDLDAEWAAIRNQPLTPEQDAAVDRLLVELRDRTVSANDVPSRSVTWPEAGPVAVAFANVTWDMASAGRDEGFASHQQWLSTVVRAVAAHPQASLVVRAHPAEAHGTTRERVIARLRSEWLPLPANVKVIDAEDTVTARQLCERAELVIAYNSTAGLEAAALGRPVLLCGRPHYRGRGATRDVASAAELKACIDAWARGHTPAAPSEAAAMARRYCHLFFLRYHMPMGWTTSPFDPPYELTLRSLRELEPGRNPVLDVVCRGILEGHQPLLPRTPEGMTACPQ